MIFSFVNPKGGAGKSTLAVHFATWLAASGLRTLLIDTDKQGSASSWMVWRIEQDLQPNPVPMRLFGEEILHSAKTHAANYDVTVIDTRGTDSSGARASIMVSDMVLVPTRESRFDAAAIDDLMEMVEAARLVNPGVRVRPFLNQIDQRRRFPWKFIDHLSENGLKPLDSVIYARVSLSNASDGETVFEQKTDEIVVAQLNRLFKEILEEARN